MKMKLVIPALLLFAAFAALSCQAGPGDLGQPDIRGTVEGFSDSAGPQDITGFILIEALLEEDSRYDRAFVTVTDHTRIYQQNGERLLKAKYENIQNGSLLEVWFNGPVAESHPVQAEAGTVVIME